MADDLSIRIADPDDRSMAAEMGATIKQALADQGKGNWPGTSA